MSGQRQSFGGTAEAAFGIRLAKDGLEALITRAVAAAKARAEKLTRVP